MLQQAILPALDEAATAVVLARGLGAKTVLAIKRQLEGLNFRVVVAGTQEAALAACGREAALLLARADETGAALFWRLRRLHEGEDRPLCVAIAEEKRAGTGLVLDMLAAGADDCLVWPFGGRLLAQRVGRALAGA